MVRYTKAKMKEINPDILQDYGLDVKSVENSRSLPERIWLQIADRFVHNCNCALIEDGNVEYYEREFGLKTSDRIIDWYGFMYEVSPDLKIEVMNGPDECNEIDISQVQMMDFNERFALTKTPEDRRNLVDQIIHLFMLW